MAESLTGLVRPVLYGPYPVWIRKRLDALVAVAMACALAITSLALTTSWVVQNTLELIFVAEFDILGEANTSYSRLMTVQA
jgi:hypothetical protein